MSSQSLPGVVTGRTVTPRRVVRQEGKDRETIIYGVLDSTACVDQGQATGYTAFIRKGALLGRNSTSGKWSVCKRSKANAAGSAATALVVDNSIHFKAGDSVVVGTNAAVTVNAVVYSTHTLTLASAKTWFDNDPVYVADGTQTARGILLDDEVVLLNYERTAAEDKTAHIMIAGFADQDKVLGDVTAILEDYDSAFALQNIIFDDYQDATDTSPAPFNLFGLKRVVFHSGSVTLTAADSGTLFVATAAATFTLPAKAAGLTFGFFNAANTDMAIASASSADDIIADGDVAADSVTFSTSSHKIGGWAFVTIQPDLLKWLCIHSGAHVGTVA